MKRFFLGVMVVLLVTVGAAWAKDFELTKKAGDYDVLIKLDKNPPVAGDNNLSVTVKDKMGMEIKEAKVAVEYSMAAMPGMPAAKYNTNTELKGSDYKTKVNFSMAGGWSMAVKVTRGGKTAQARFNIDVR